MWDLDWLISVDDHVIEPANVCHRGGRWLEIGHVAGSARSGDQEPGSNTVGPAAETVGAATRLSSPVSSGRFPCVWKR